MALRDETDRSFRAWVENGEVGRAAEWLVRAYADQVIAPDGHGVTQYTWYENETDPGRRHYWKLIFWALRRPRHLPLAVTLAIYGFHFRKTFAATGQLKSIQ